MSRWASLIVIFLFAGMPLCAQTAGPHYLPDVDRMCRTSMENGMKYEIWDRVFLTEWEGKPLYVKLHAYYMPESGNFLYRSTGLSEHGYETEPKDKPAKLGAACKETYPHIVLLEEGEWADFWAERGRIVIFHCTLKFGTREQAWAYAQEHWEEAADDARPGAKWAKELLVFKEIGYEFFRPKKLEYDARPYSYESLASVKKTGVNWELVLNGADKPNRATVLLDRKFNLLSVKKDVSAE